MKKTIVAFAAIGAAVAGQSVHAADGTINFTGRLIAQTCTIDVNGTTTPTVATVTLPTVSTGRLASAGNVTGRTGFTIGLNECSGTATRAAAFFESGATVDPATGRLRTTSGTGHATNVQLQLVDASTGNAIRAGDVSQHAGNTKVDLDDDKASLPYAVEYYATGATTAGTVASSVTYSINYE